MAYLSYLGPNASLLDIFGQDEARFSPLIPFVQSVMRGPSEFSHEEREILAAYVSALNSCNFCYAAHRAVAEDLSVDPLTIDMLVVDPEAALLDAKLLPVLKLTRKLTNKPSSVTQRDVDAVVNAGWGEKAVEDLTCICGLFSLLNRLVDGVGIQSEGQNFEALAHTVRGAGYDALLSLAGAPADG